MCAQAQRPTREPHEVQFPQFSGDRKKDNNKLMSFKASLSRWPGPLLTPPSVVRQPKQGKEKEATYRHPSFIVDHQAIVEPLFTKLYICFTAFEYKNCVFHQYFIKPKRGLPSHTTCFTSASTSRSESFCTRT